MSKPRVLCVDDEPRVLDGLRLVLGRRYELFTAESGAEGLEVLDAEGPFEAVVSDMRMPQMNGAVFLAEVRKRAEDTTRLLLTGGTDMESAIKAVELHRLKSAEKVLLEQTLRGSIQALTDVLGLASPVAFGRAGRIKRRVVELAEEMGELAQAVRKGDHDAKVHEFGDVLAWVATLANQQGVDLTEAIERFAAGCPKCHGLPCTCP